MHMADALLSPVVGGAFWAASAATIAVSAKKTAAESDGSRTVLMGVLGAFVFAAQMINFTIPGTGSSGHIGGGLLLAVLLGPWRAFITLASVLVVQALFFADGGLLALGANIFNLAFIPAFIALPLLYRPIAGSGSSPVRIGAASLVGVIGGLLAGAFMVVVQTTLSGISDLPFTTFLLFMLPIHAAIGLVEGVMTWGVLASVRTAEPGLLNTTPNAAAPNARLVTTALLTLALATGGVLSLLASPNPDGLEWSIGKVVGAEELRDAGHSLHATLAALQERLSFLPDYGFRDSAGESELGTSASGITGSLIVLLAAGGAGLLLRRRHTGESRT